MAKRLFLHIGGEKTGTKSLQQFLRRNSLNLQSAGILYPTNPERPYCHGDAHFPVAAALLDTRADFISKEKQETLSSALESLHQDIREGPDTFILSCEHFSSRLVREEQLIRLRSYLPPETFVVFYLRNQVELAISSYSTKIKSGRRQEFDLAEVNIANPYFNHLMTINLWSSVFGSEHLLLRDYDNIDRDVCHDFCDLVGLPYSRLESVSPLNRSLSATMLEAVRSMNLFLPNGDEDLEGWRRAQKVRKAAIRCAPEDGNRFSPGPAAVSEIRRRFKSVNDEINARYFGGSMGQHWAATTAAAHESQSSPSDVVSCLARIAIKLATEQLSGNSPSRKPPRDMAPRLTPPGPAKSVPQPFTYIRRALRRIGRSKIAVIQSSDPIVYSDMLAHSSRVTEFYCRLHGYEYRKFVGLRLGFHPWQAIYNRIFQLKDLAEEGFKGWVFYLDADAIIVNPRIDAREIIPSNSCSLIAARSGATDNFWDINNGVFLINLGSPDGRAILQRWYERTCKIPEDSLRRADQWGTLPGSQRTLHEVLASDPALAQRALHYVPKEILNSGQATFVQQYLRASNQSVDERAKRIAAKADAVLWLERSAIRHDQ